LAVGQNRGPAGLAGASMPRSIGIAPRSAYFVLASSVAKLVLMNFA